MAKRGIVTLGPLAAVVVGLAACGSSGSSNEIVARVTGVGAISKATLEHWIPIEAVIVYQERPSRPVPTGLNPDPPNYTACMKYLNETPQKLVESGAKPSALELKHKCAEKHKELKELTLNTLIGWEWTIGAGLALGVKVSNAEVRRWFERVSKSEHPKKGEFARYLRFTGQTVPDMLFRSKVQLIEVKLVQQRTVLEKRVPKGLTARQQQHTALARFVKAMPPSRAWAAKTSCQLGYVVSSCGQQYRGSASVGFPN